MPIRSRERSFTQINFIDVPNAVQSEISLVNTLDLKWLIKTFPSSYCHLHTCGDFNSYLNMNLREEHGWTYGASTVIAGKYVSKLKFFCKKIA
jgi:hypothetical protein